MNGLTCDVARARRGKEEDGAGDVWHYAAALGGRERLGPTHNDDDVTRVASFAQAEP